MTTYVYMNSILFNVSTIENWHYFITLLTWVFIHKVYSFRRFPIPEKKVCGWETSTASFACWSMANLRYSYSIFKRTKQYIFQIPFQNWPLCKSRKGGSIIFPGGGWSFNFFPPEISGISIPRCVVCSLVWNCWSTFRLQWWFVSDDNKLVYWTLFFHGTNGQWRSHVYL